MKISLDWVCDFVDLPGELDATDIAHQLTLKTVEVEEVHVLAGDVVLEIDNKSLTNRPDLWGHYGIAREFAAIFDLKLKPLPVAPRPADVDGLVGSLDPASCSRLCAVRFHVPESVPTPALIRDRLARIGEGSIGLCVDLSNYVMFTVGQPTHVYDAQRLSLPLSVSTPRAETPLELVTGQPVTPAIGSPVVVDRTTVVALAGVMGSLATAVGPGSTDFVLEAASFPAQAVRRSAQLAGLRSEASTRYEKSLDTQRVELAVGYFLHLLAESAPASVVAGLQDVHLEPTVPARIEVERPFLDDRIGESLQASEIVTTLTALGFDVADDGERFSITAPTWRSTGDVSLPHDIIEEIARIHGYDELPTAAVPVTLASARSLNRTTIERVAREQLSMRGRLREVITYPWASDQMLRALGIRETDTVRFDQPPAPHLGSLRPTLIPNLLSAVAQNLPYYPAVRIFEVGVVFEAGPLRRSRPDFEPLPPQHSSLAIAVTGDDGSALFTEAKGFVELLERTCFICGLVIGGESSAPWADPNARVALKAGGKDVGAVGVLRPQVRRAAGITAPQVACVELALDSLRIADSRDNSYDPPSAWPEATFDLSVVVADSVTWERVERVVRAGRPLVRTVRYRGEYRGSWVPPGHRSLTIGVTLRPARQTLTAEEIGTQRAAIIDALGASVGATQRSVT
jgi:phenylalanyl-tRNA synthetase beta chain